MNDTYFQRMVGVALSLTWQNFGQRFGMMVVIGRFGTEHF
jgi:hypothetical protein